MLFSNLHIEHLQCIYGLWTGPIIWEKHTEAVFETCPSSKVEHSTSHTYKTSLEMLASVVGDGLLMSPVAMKSLGTGYDYFFSFWPRRAACGILILQPGIEPEATAVKAPSPNHWTTRELPGCEI